MAMLPTPNTALVTGARRGIGRAIAFALADAGFALVVNDVVADGASDETMAGIESRGARSVFVEGDIARLETHGAMLDAVEAELGPIGCLVNNAGVQVPERVDLLETTPDVFDHLIAVNLRGTFFLTQEVARRMLGSAGEGRSIITISSINASMASVEKGPYCVSKAGLTMVNRLFALRLAAHGIAAYEIRPGLIRTDMTARVRESYGAAIANGLSPIPRWGEPEDVAGAIASLATGAIPFSTGSAFTIDGGVELPRL
jgi:NAD(P)-dependent dehydrogenase (short-subunit alcohol dehydrogenase family)